MKEEGKSKGKEKSVLHLMKLKSEEKLENLLQWISTEN